MPHCGGHSEISQEGSLHLQYLQNIVKDSGYCFKLGTFRREIFKIRFIILRNHGGILEMSMEEETTKRDYSESVLSIMSYISVLSVCERTQEAGRGSSTNAEINVYCARLPAS